MSIGILVVQFFPLAEPPTIQSVLAIQSQELLHGYAAQASLASPWAEIPTIIFIEARKPNQWAELYTHALTGY